MMKNKPLRILLCMLMICVMLTPTVLNAGASKVAISAYDLLNRDLSKNYAYINPTTGYRASIIDEDKLLDNSAMLKDAMTPLTEYGTVVFWSCPLSKDEQDQQVDEWQDSELATDSCILVINPEEGVLNLYTSGAIYRSVSQKKLQEINDEMLPLVNAGKFDAAAIAGFSEVCSVMSGKSGDDDPDEKQTSDDSGAQSDVYGVQYENPDTGYQVMMLDDAGLLTDAEKQELIAEMTPITEYGHIIFWSTDESASDAEVQAREKRASYYGRQSAGIFSINMAKRKVVFHADGAIYDAVDSSDARSITDNVSGYASSKNYFKCAKEGFRQVLMRLRGQAIAEPMKYTSYVIIALMLAFVIVVGLAFGVFNPLRKNNKKQALLYGSGQLLASPPVIRKTGSDTRAWVDVVIIILTSFLRSGGGGGSSGGGSSSGGGGGGSSGGGGGGSSSF